MLAGFLLPIENGLSPHKPHSRSPNQRTVFATKLRGITMDKTLACIFLVKPAVWLISELTIIHYNNHAQLLILCAFCMPGLSGCACAPDRLDKPVHGKFDKTIK
jgi:hypothetical protein